MNNTDISWTDYSWNPVTGCTQCSAGCRNCYAKEIAENRQGREFKVTLHGERLFDPYSEKKGGLVFVCSMSDLFHEEVPFGFTDKVMNTVKSATQHTYQLLTKRPERMAEYFSTRDVPRNVWLGTTVESADYRHRIDTLRGIDASTRFLSCEPLVGDLGELNLDGIGLVIVGGEQTSD